MKATRFLVCALLLASACGDSGDDATDGGDPPLLGGAAPVRLEYTGDLQIVEVPPNVRTAVITAVGAAGGIGIPRSSASRLGLGMSMSGDFDVRPGDTLAVLVGGRGEDGTVGNQGWGNVAAGGGGGASAVWKGFTFSDLTASSLMIVAGGGGGQGSYGKDAGDAAMSRNGNGTTSLYSGSYSGGTNGSGGQAYPCVGGGGGGAGVFGAGEDAGKGGTPSRPCFGAGAGGRGGSAIAGGAAGGTPSPPTSGFTGNSGAGGFGGGGGAGSYTGGGGGGGGYSGGAGGLSNNASDPNCGGAGGGSYSVANIQINREGVGTGNGSVSITFR